MKFHPEVLEAHQGLEVKAAEALMGSANSTCGRGGSPEAVKAYPGAFRAIHGGSLGTVATAKTNSSLRFDFLKTKAQKCVGFSIKKVKSPSSTAHCIPD